MAVLDINRPKKGGDLGASAVWLKWELERLGVKPGSPARADFILATVASAELLPSLRGRLRRVKNKRARVIIGGGASYAPAAFDNDIDLCCVGEGRRFLHTLIKEGFEAAAELPNAWVPGESREVIPDDQFPWDLPPIINQDGSVRLFAQRGCRYRCAFCQTGWAQPFIGNPNMGRLRRQTRALKGRGYRVVVTTNDGFDRDLPRMPGQSYLSGRFDSLLRYGRISRKDTRCVRFGLEGISERMRAALGKPAAHEDLKRVSWQMAKGGIDVRWFFIPGLPGERAEDYEELKDLVIWAKRSNFPRIILCNMHAFLPMPSAPLGVLPLGDSYYDRFYDFYRWHTGGPGHTSRFHLVNCCKPPERLRRSRLNMAATEAELRRGWFENENRNWRIRYQVSPDRLRKLARAFLHRAQRGTDNAKGEENIEARARTEAADGGAADLQGVRAETDMAVCK